MILITVFLAFIQIGFLAFGGGYAILPFINDIVVNAHGWLTPKEMTDIVTISQMTPGPIAINAATFVGTKLYGLLGSIVATSAIVLPQLIIMCTLAYLYFGNKKITFMKKIISTLRPAIVGLIFIATLDMIFNSVFNGLSVSIKNINYIALITFFIGLILSTKKVGIIKIIVIGGILGILLNIMI